MQRDLNHISYAYPTAAQNAIDDISATFPQGWTGIVGDNGCGKTTLARIAAGIIKPDTGTVSPRLFCAYCPQDSSVAPDSLFEFASDWSQEACRIRKMLNIDEDWLWRYDTLSGGQQKRIQIGCALNEQPDVLVMDEPTNDLDEQTKELVKMGLASFEGIGILISHDRALLDALASQCLVFEGLNARMRPGGYSKAIAQARSDLASVAREREHATHEVKRLEAEARRRSEEASRQRSKRSRSGLAKKDSDARERISRAIVSGKDGVAGKLSASMDRRLKRMSGQARTLQAPKRYEPRFSMHGSVSKGSVVAHLEEGVLRRGSFSLSIPEVWISPTDHIALTGANGSGKSLIMQRIADTIPPSVSCAYIPQEVSAPEREAALRQLRTCDPALRGRILSLVATLNSDPERLLDGDEISPGELRKLVLATKLQDDPHLLLLDEPTNHLDVGSIEALQRLLIAFPGAVLLISHDATLVNEVARSRWKTQCVNGSWILREE